MMGTYGPPVDQLLKIDDNLWERRWKGRVEWDDYRAMGIGPEHVPDLIRMALDPELLAFEEEGPAGWAPIHAWRALGVLRAEEAIPTLIGIIADQAEDEINDAVVQELPTVLAMIGPAATFPLTALVEDEDATDGAREDACSALTEVALKHPGERPGVVATLTRWLERAEWHNPISNAFMVDDLIRLEARESAEVIERAFAGGFVDETIAGTWHDVWHELKLEGEPPPPPETPRFDPAGWFDMDPDMPDDLFGGPLEPPGPPRAGWQPIEAKTPEERKDRNKARKNLEKKAKGKGKGGKRR